MDNMDACLIFKTLMNYLVLNNFFVGMEQTMGVDMKLQV